jgi:hypothetical protein
MDWAQGAMPTLFPRRNCRRLVRGIEPERYIMARAWQEEQAVAEQLPAQAGKQRGRPKRPQGAQRLRVLTLRLPEELLRRLDAYTAQMQAAQPYLRLSRADVLRIVLDKGLPTTS